MVRKKNLHLMTLLVFMGCSVFASEKNASDYLDHLDRDIAYTLKQTEGLDIHPQLEEFAAINRVGEMSWLLAQNSFYVLSELLEDSLAEFLRKSPVIKEEVLSGGCTTTLLLTLERDIKVVFKPYNILSISSNVGSEVGTYLIDKLLDLHIVPVTVQKKYNSSYGSAQYFVKDAIVAKKLKGHARKKPKEMLLLDYLIKNVDRHAGNYMYLESLHKFIAIDNGWAIRGNNVLSKIKRFFIDKRTKREMKRLFEKDEIPDIVLFNKLKEIPEDSFDEALQATIPDCAIERLVRRRGKIVHSLSKHYNE